MKSAIRFIIITSLVGIAFAGCSFSDIFSKLASSDVERGAQEEYNQSKIIETKKKIIEQKKQTFQETAELKNVNEANNYVAYAFRKTDGKTTQIDIEAMLPSPDRQVYEVWLRGTGSDVIDLGPLKFNQTDDYSLTYSTEKDLTGKNSIIISREAVLDDKPETIIMAGAFVSPSSSPLTSSTH